MSRFLMLLGAAAGLLAPATRADLLEDFEDGDFTSDPVWVVSGSPLGQAQVVPDPVRPDNLVLRARADSVTFLRLRTMRDHPRQGFDLSYELLRPESAFEMICALEGTDAANDRIEFAVLGSGAGTLQFRLYANGTTWTVAGFPAFPPSWCRLHVWHDPQQAQVKLAARLESGLPIGGEFGPVDLAGLPDLASVSLAFRGPD